MKPIQESLGTDRSVVALAGAFLWVGTGAGGIFMGWLSDRIGVRATVAIGAGMIAAGLVLSSLGWIWSLYHRPRADGPVRQRRRLSAACWSMSAAGSTAAAARRSR